MLLQNIRAKIGARLNGDSEGGFTLIELLVVMLILGILAAIALPAFFNQKDKAGDAEAKATAHTVQVAVETCATEGKPYSDCDTTEVLQAIEGTIPSSGVTVTAPDSGEGVGTYTISVTADGSNNVFSINRATTGTLTYTCTTAGKGGCPPAAEGQPGVWDQ